MQLDPEKDLVYGPIDDYLVFLPRTKAPRLLAIRTALNSSSTWGELQQTLPADAYQEIVELMRENEEDEELPEDWEPDADDPVDADEIPGFADGDWPEWPAQEALEWVPESIQDRYGDVVTSVLNGNYLELDATQEHAIVAAFIEEGYSCERDDALVLRAHGYDLYVTMPEGTGARRVWSARPVVPERRNIIKGIHRHFSA